MIRLADNFLQFFVVHFSRGQVRELVQGLNGPWNSEVPQTRGIFEGR